MSWTTPKTWSANEIVGAADMNTHIRDNMNALKDPPFYQTAITANWSASATTWTGISSLSAVLNTYGGDIMVHFQAFIWNEEAAVNLQYNGTSYVTTTSGLARTMRIGLTGTNIGNHVTYTVWVTGLPSGTHVFAPVVKTDNGQWAQLQGDRNPIMFWVREAS